MKVPLSWLRDYVDVDVPLDVLASKLVLSGLEVDRIVRRGAPDTDGNHGHFRIGRVVEWRQHPNADRLRLCRVDTGDAEPRQIVCGASNFLQGDTVVVALPGAILPGADAPLRQARLRGELSDGMMLSERELQLSDEHDGIIRLRDGYPVGSLARDHFALTETVFEVEVTSNRADLLSVYGIAREVATLLDVELRPMPGVAPEATGSRPTSAVVSAGIDAPDRCFRFTARAFDDVTVGPSPLRIRQRVSAAGMRPISNVVDITNYVMIGIGNPTHAYDGAKIPGRVLTARLARDGEELVTLDSKHRRLTSDMLVIADADRPNGLAGIMGGEGSEIADDTRTVVIEVANFERSGIQRTCAALALRTDGSNRWCRGVDPHLAPQASAWNAQLMVELTGASLLPGDQDVVARLPERERITLRSGRAGAVLGMSVDDDEATAILDRLGYEPERVADGVSTRVPTWRWLDTTREIDLVEEVGRIHGLEKLPATIPSGSGGGLSHDQSVRRRVEDALAGAGLHEALTVSLVDPGMVDTRFDPIALTNPLSGDYALMRPTLLPNLLRVIRRNRAAGRVDVGVFEVAHVYRAAGGRVTAERLADEPWTVAGALGGRLGGSGWTGEGLPSDFFTAKGVLEAVCARLGVVVALEPTTVPHLHPGRAATILLGADRTPAGEVGELHPAHAEQLDLDGRIAVFELDLEVLAAATPGRVTYAAVPEQPPVRQDIALVVADDVPAAALVAAALEVGAPLLTSAGVFDVYRDDARLGAGKLSLAIRLVFQDPERTLTEDEASGVRSTIVARLAERFGAELRG